MKEKSEIKITDVNAGDFKRRFMVVAYFIGILFLFLILFGCRTHKTSSETAEVSVEKRESVRTMAQNDTFVSFDAAAGTRTDTSTLAATDRGSVVIERDTAGRPVRIGWERRQSGVSMSKSDISEKSGKTERLDRSDRTRTEEEISTQSSSKNTESDSKGSATATRAQRIECFIGSSLLLAGLIYIIYTVIVDQFLPWYRNRKR